ncbi:hypothetical protein [Methylocella sp.]|uniref:hypothetical protein n=1 Tax=Methylocella sp. TaxID=1978226 RepID=UPI0037832BE3
MPDMACGRSFAAVGAQVVSSETGLLFLCATLLFDAWVERLFQPRQFGEWSGFHLENRTIFDEDHAMVASRALVRDGV